jgi:hypothetical protein
VRLPMHRQLRCDLVQPHASCSPRPAPRSPLPAKRSTLSPKHTPTNKAAGTARRQRHT